jgi:DNA modification methylase
MIINANNIEELKKFDDNYFDSIVTDPPYEIGFMGKSWDASGIANNLEMWSECLRVLKPGGYLLSFSATRTYHRMAVAIEDSGFEIRDIIEWVYGSGFPKSLNIGKAVDKLQGNEREVSGKYQHPRSREQGKENDNSWGEKSLNNTLENYNTQSDDKRTLAERLILTKGTSEWEGWGTALKPAHEPICMARKPLAEKTVAENCLKYGTGGINIDESRVESDNPPKERPVLSHHKSYKEAEFIPGQGRFPANLIHDNSEEVRECFPETGKGGHPQKANESENNCLSGKNYARERDSRINTDSGNASRFFKSIIYQAKASKSERGVGNIHPTVKPVALMEYLIKMVTPTNGIVLDPFMGSGSTGVACVLNNFEFVGIDLDKDYCEIARARIEGVKETQTKMF